MSTIPTKITQKQYENATLAVDRSNGDHWLFWASDGSTVYDKMLWLCRNQSALSENYADLDRAEVQGIDVTDENGNLIEIEAWTFRAKQLHVNELDLEALADGEVKWF